MVKYKTVCGKEFKSNDGGKILLNFETINQENEKLYSDDIKKNVRPIPEKCKQCKAEKITETMSFMSRNGKELYRIKANFCKAKLNQKLDLDNRHVIICPHCGHEYSEKEFQEEFCDMNYNYLDDEEEYEQIEDDEYECRICFEKFKLKINKTITYSTSK